ncbi:50S ribosomal protein L22 [Candidatus Peregrinibacteria bacterium]|nr:50S ribosomal protein L22 [Candidatus Peregrinibacteria bacterium]
MKAIRRYLRISPKKVNLVADLVRGKNVDEAINFLRFTPKKSAKPLMEVIKSAVANAEQNFKQQRKDLYVSKIVVNGGSTLKRHRPVSRGRAHPILKRTCHIVAEVAVLGAGESVPARKIVKQEAPKKVEKSPKTEKPSKK